MFKFIQIAALLFVLAGCATRSQVAKEQIQEDIRVGRAAGVYTEENDLDSFRVSDADGPKLTDEELEKIPTEINPQVEMWISYFQGRGRPHMERYLARSTRYEKLMKRVLRDNGLPEDLFYIALIESGFSSHATSHAAAVGYWQFIRGTGKRYGLEISRFVDERRDPVLATQAAAEYFKGLYSIFGSWYLAMASYNVGENRVKKEVVRNNTKDFWELHRLRRLPKETMNYVPKYIAAKLIGTDPKKYGFDEIDYLPAIEFDHISIDKPVNLRVMAEKMNFNYEDFKALNPKFKGEVAPLKNDTLSLRIPPGSKEVAIVAASESVVENLEFIADAGDTETYRIRRGDTLSSIAKKYRTTVAFLRDINDLPKRKKLRVGMRIQVPDRTPVSSKRPVVKKEVKVKERVQTGPFYIVQSGDSLYTIAKKYDTSIAELQRLNNLRRGSVIKAGVKIKVPVKNQPEQPNVEEQKEAKAQQGTSNSRKKINNSKKVAQKKPAKKLHVVKRGENLSTIANRYNVPIRDLIKKNKLADSKLFVGSKLVIPQ
ncbi:MAG: LysM peptidoglycan-binding domain-containing protein [Bdellovibrionia bacterium]